MTLLSPLALLWLASVPVLLWLWRLAATRRRMHVPSLVPFERLLARPPRRRTRLLVNLLFWLQLAALIGLALALAHPVVTPRRAKTVLAILDTSASMDARQGSERAFERAARALTARIARKAPGDRWLVMTTSPVESITPQSTSDTAMLTQAVAGLRVAHLGGNLSTTVRIGLALLGDDPDEIVVVTDEPLPAEPPEDRVRWVQVGRPLPNVGIVGLDAQGPLCASSDARMAVTLHNFSDDESSVTIVASQRGERLADGRETIPPGARRTIALSIAPSVEGWVEVSLLDVRDGLEADNRAWIDIQRRATLPIQLSSHAASFTSTVSAWLDACPSLVWTTQPPSGAGPTVMITDHLQDLGSAVASAMVFLPPDDPRPMPSHWVVSAAHPIGAYLAPIEVVNVPLNLSADATSGVPVVSGLVNGRKVPLVVAEEREGRRIVWMRFDPSGHDAATPVVLAFFNSLRWLMGASSSRATGDPMMLTGFAPGAVRVQRPDG